MSFSSKETAFNAIHKSVILLICFMAPSVLAWSPPRQFNRISSSSPSAKTSLRMSDPSTDESPSESSSSGAHDTRRRFLSAAAMNVCLMGIGAPAVIAADSSYPPGTTFVSGKKPLPPGETVKKSDNTKGTRKDPDFLRSIADCRNQCQSTPGPDGLAKSKEDCLSECQDICCTTYEQCTFNIVPRL